jgi:hypothetical protein
MNFFFGMEVLPSKVYKSTPPEGSFLHISQAAIPADAKEGRVSLKATVEDATYVLCTLNAGQIDQCPLDLNFSAGREVQFSSSGTAVPIHLTGYFEAIDEDEIDYSDDEGFEGADMGASDESEEEEDDIPPPPAKKVKTEPKSEPEIKKIPINTVSQKKQDQPKKQQGGQDQQKKQNQQPGSQSPKAKPSQPPAKEQEGQKGQKGAQKGGQQQGQQGQKQGQQQPQQPQKQQGGQQQGAGEGKKKKKNKNKNKNKNAAA